MRQILCTRSIPSALIEAAAAEGTGIRIEEFIRVETRVSGEAAILIAALAGMPDAIVVFTSKHAVEAVAASLQTMAAAPQPRWRLYCISAVTASVAAARFPCSVLAGAGSCAGDVAREILAAGESGEVWFFSGDRRRDTLPAQLAAGGRHVRETVVYETILTPHSVPGFFDGILFFSPSGVESYFSANRPDPRTVLFAIGGTTAGALKEKSPNPVVVSERQEAGALVRASTEYFIQK